MKLQLEEEEKKAREHKEELEVRCNFQLFRRNIIPTQSQKGNRRKDLEREKKEKEAMEHKERLEVHREPYLLRQCTVLTPRRGKIVHKVGICTRRVRDSALHGPFDWSQISQTFRL